MYVLVKWVRVMLEVYCGATDVLQRRPAQSQKTQGQLYITMTG